MSPVCDKNAVASRADGEEIVTDAVDGRSCDIPRSANLALLSDFSWGRVGLWRFTLSTGGSRLEQDHGEL
jgi:hypothetical protein